MSSGRSQNVTKKRMMAAAMLAEDVLTDEQIASKCAITRRTLARWKSQNDFIETIKGQKTAHLEGAKAAAASKGFDTVARLAELAQMTPEQTNGNITGQVRACLGIAEIRGEVVQLHGDVTDRLRNKSPEELDFIAINRRDPANQEELERFIDSRKQQKVQ